LRRIFKLEMICGVCAPRYAHASFSLTEIPDSALLTDVEVAGFKRWSTNTVPSWRRQPDHPLKWELVAGRFVRYRAGDLKAYMAAGRVVSKRQPPAPPKRGAATLASTNHPSGRRQLGRRRDLALNQGTRPA
jgi:hypothetical protein